MKNSLLKLHAAVFLWGFTGVLGRLITLNEALLVWYRLLITTIILYFLLRWHKKLQNVSRKQMIELFGIGAIVALHWVCFYGSIKYSNVSIALTCLSSAGLFTAILEPLMTGNKINPREVLLGMVGIAGIWLIFHFDPQYKTGIIAGLIASALSCVFSILNKKQVEHIYPRTMMLFELGGGFCILTLFMPLYLYVFPTKHLFPSWADAFWLFLLSGICTVLAMDLSLQALKKVSAFTQNLTLNLEPVYGILLAFAVYKENRFLSDGFYIGFTLILLAVVLQMLRLVHSARKELKVVE